jgi:hypothetical protein
MTKSRNEFFFHYFSSATPSSFFLFSFSLLVFLARAHKNIFGLLLTELIGMGGKKKRKQNLAPNKVNRHQVSNPRPSPAFFLPLIFLEAEPVMCKGFFWGWEAYIHACMQKKCKVL